MENIFKYEILPVKIPEYQNKKTRKRQTNNPNQQIVKEKQELNNRNNNNISKNSNTISNHFGTFSLKMRALKINLKNLVIIKKKIKVTNLQLFILDQIIDDLFPLLFSINEKGSRDLFQINSCYIRKVFSKTKQCCWVKKNKFS